MHINSISNADLKTRRIHDVQMDIETSDTLK